MASVSLLVVNYYTREHVEALLSSMESQPPFQEMEVLVGDNTPGGELSEDPRYRLFPFQENLGFASACNYLAEKARGTYLFLANPDLTFTQSLAPLLPLIQGDVVGVVPLIQPRQRFQLRRLPTPLRLFVDFGGLVNLWKKNPISRWYYYDKIPLQPFKVEQPAFCALLIKKEVYLALGGLDTRFYPAWFEDVDFCIRAKQQGYHFLCHPGCTVSHALGVTAQRLGRRKFLSYYVHNLRQLGKKHFPFHQRFLLELILLWGCLIRGVPPW